MRATAGRLPDSVLELLDGTDLEGKIGQAFLLITCEPDGWPRLALLSVGEVLAPSATRIYLALYADSGTTQVLTGAGRALLILVQDGVTYKVRLTTERIAASVRSDGVNTYFCGRVVAVAEDQVGYARVVRGIEYELVDERAVLDRWQQQLDRLRQLGA